MSTDTNKVESQKSKNLTVTAESNETGKEVVPLSYKEAQAKFSQSFFGTNVRLEAAFLMHRKKSKCQVCLPNVKINFTISARFLYKVCKIRSQTPPSRFSER